MFWFFSQTLASVLNAEWLKAVCSVRTVIVFKQGSLCLFKRMGKWLSWQIRLKKQDSHGLAQMSTFATWLAFWGILNKSGLCAGRELCSAPGWGMWVRATARPWVSLWARVPRFEIFQSRFNCVIIKLMEPKRNSSCWLPHPIPGWFRLTSHVVPVASLSRSPGDDHLHPSFTSLIFSWREHWGQLWLSGKHTGCKFRTPESSPSAPTC